MKTFLYILIAASVAVMLLFIGLLWIEHRAELQYHKPVSKVRSWA